MKNNLGRGCHQAILLMLFTVCVAYGQELTGTFTGTVSDASGAVLPGVTVAITNNATGVRVYTGATDAQGVYLAPSLPVGVYNLSFEGQGFKRTDVRGVTLQVSQRARVDATLEAGAVSESINITGDTLGQLETETSSVGATFGSQQISNLPLPSRNVLNLLTLVGGVSSGGAATGINSSQLSINGSRTLNSEITVDGLSVLGGATGEVTRLPSTEALREFRVLTSAYSAEYGRTSGGYVNAVVGSGTKEFHGGAYEYFRNEKLNANNFFNNARGIARQTDRFNQFGAKLGGPIWLPRRLFGPLAYEGRERTFFFVNYEGLRRAVPYTSNITLPDARYRAGDFSASTVRVFDPLTRQQFPDNRIPDSRIDPAARKILGLLPLPNQAGTLDVAANARATNNYVNPGSTRPTNDEITARVDHAFNQNARSFGRFTHFRSLSPAQLQIAGPFNPADSDSQNRHYQVALGHTQTFSPTLIGELSFGFLRNRSARDPATLGIDSAGTLGIARSPFPVVPRLAITGFSGLGSQATNISATNTFQAAGSLSLVRGGQVIKLGTQFRRNQFNAADPGTEYGGLYNFTGRITSANNTGNNPVNAFADFLLGQISSATYDIPQPLTGRRNYNLAFFAQDDWKVTRRLTLNLGLRYEYESPVTEVNNFISRLDKDTGKLLVAGRNSSRSVNNIGDKLNLAPRVGFAYSVTDQTVVRGAFGSFYSQSFSNIGGIVRMIGYTGRANFLDPGTAFTAQPFTLSQGLPLTAVQSIDDPFVVERASSAAVPLSPISTTQGKIDPLPYSLQWNLGVQHNLGGGVVVDVSYVGSRGVHLPLILPYNDVPFDRVLDVLQANTPLARQNARPYPNLDRFQVFTNEGTSKYHSLQLKGERRLSRRLSFQTTYTFSKSIDDGSGIFNFSQPAGLDAGQFPRLRRDLESAVSAFDRTHTFAAAGTLTTPGPWWARDFQISPILVWRTGLPDTITQNTFNPAAIQQRPNQISERSLYLDKPVNEGAGIRYLLSPLDPNFPLAPSGPFFIGSGATRTNILPGSLFGNLGRNTVREPGEINLDLSVGRRFAIRENFGVQFRAEAFNVLNHTNFNAPATGLNVVSDANNRAVFNNPAFGLITSAKSARFVQLVLRVEF